MGEGATGSGSGTDPGSEGFTALLSNGDELLRLLEHCRVVVDNVVDAPQALLAAGKIGNASLEWKKKISWFQARLCRNGPSFVRILFSCLCVKVPPNSTGILYPYDTCVGESMTLLP